MASIIERVSEIKNRQAQLDKEEDKQTMRFAADGALFILSSVASAAFHPLFLIGTVVGGADMIRRGFRISDIQDIKRENYPKAKLVKRRGPYILKKNLFQK
jgi:hypothetical protein